MTADITLVNLNFLYVRYSDSYDREHHLPLGVLYLITALEDAGYKVDFRDYQMITSPDPFSFDSFMEFLEDPAPIIGLSCMANLLPYTILAAQKLKHRYPNHKIVLGGVGTKSVERAILERFEWIDVVAHGEGERMIAPLVRALKLELPLSLVPGIFYKEPNGAISQTPSPPRIRNLDEIGRPAYHRIDLGDYDACGMISSRGCPYKCTFCSVAPIWNHKCFFRSPEDVVEEMRELSEVSGIDLFLFQDEFFVSSKKAVMGFCEALRRSNLDVHWKAFARVDLSDEEMLSAMAKTGCIEVRFGIETGSPRMLEATKKGFTPEMATQVVSLATGLFPRVDTFFVWGYPDETLEDFYQSLFQMISFRLMGARILPSLLSLLPQTEIYHQLGPSGRERLEFCEQLMPEYVTTGHEICGIGTSTIEPKYEHLFKFIKENKDLFPGFFLLDVEERILPKLTLLREHGFYCTSPDLTTKPQVGK